MKKSTVVLVIGMLLSSVLLFQGATAETEQLPYAFSESPAALPFAPDDLSSGQPLNLADDQLSAPLTLGFDFRFFGVPRNSVYVASNGYLTFLAAAVPSGPGRPVPRRDGVEAVVAGLWEDLIPDAGSIRYAVMGPSESKRFVVEYRDVKRCCSAKSVTFQIKLFEGSNAIEVHYVDVPAGTHNASAGIEDHSGAYGVQYFFGIVAKHQLAVRYAMPPSAPRDLVAWADGARRIGLMWDAPEESGSFAVSTYRIFRRASGGSMQWVADAAASPYYDGTVADGKSYTYAVSAQSQAGESPRSNEVMVTAPSVPGQPTNLVAVPLVETSSTQAVVKAGRTQLSWDRPPSGGLPITSWKVEVRPTDGEWTTLEGATPTQAAAFRMELRDDHCPYALVAGSESGGAQASVKYVECSYRVSASNEAGYGPASSEAYTFSTWQPPPPEPLDVTAEASSRRVAIRWQPPASSVRVLYYRVYVWNGEDTSREAQTVGITPGTSWVNVFSANDGATSSYAVSAVGTGGEGPKSPVVSVMAPGTPGSPTIIATRREGQEVALVWLPPHDKTDSVRGYEVHRGESAEFVPSSGSLRADLAMSDLVYRESVPDVDTTYYYKVLATSPAGAGPASSAAEVSPQP